MPELKTAKYVKETVRRPSHHKEIPGYIPMLSSDERYGNMGFNMYWEGIATPFVHAPGFHSHDFLRLFARRRAVWSIGHKYVVQRREIPAADLRAVVIENNSDNVFLQQHF